MKTRAVVLILIACAAQFAVADDHTLSVKVSEVVASGNSTKDTPLGSVFDLRNVLRLNISYPGSPSSSPALAQSLSDLKKLVDAGTKLSAQVDQFAQAGPNSASLAGTIANEILDAVKPLPAATQQEVFGAPQIGKGPVGLLRGIVAKLGSVSSQMAASAKVQQDTIGNEVNARTQGQQISATVTITQYRSEREGRTYTKDLSSFLSVSDAEETLAKSLTTAQLQKNLNDWSSNELKKLKTSYDSSVQPDLTKLETDVKADKTEVQTAWADVEKAIAQLKSINVSDALTLAPEIETDVDAVKTQIDKLVSQATVQTVKDGLTKVEADLKDLVDEAKNDAATILNLGQVEQIAQQVANLVLAPNDANSIQIGSKGDPRLQAGHDYGFDLGNGDKIRILVTEKPTADPTAKPATDLDQSSHAYKLGWNLLHTITYDGFEQEGNHRIKFAPAVNFLAKPFTRNLSMDTTTSIGLGVTWFPIGVDQQDSGTVQQAIGVVGSLFDDWVTIGYARNFTTNAYFLFVGATVPVKF